MVVDHIDNNSLNNCLDNLQIITPRKNTSKDRKGHSSKYIGVTWHKQASKWVVHILNNNKREYLGLFEIELDAANAYKKRLNDILT